MAKRSTEDEFMRKLGKSVRAVREELGYSVNDFSALVQISRAHLYRIELGASPPNMSVIYRVALLARKNVSEFLKDSC